ncbi:MAG: PPOX class F420-dependent oxidoreductase [Actinomycetota bacterium]|nr:PPOX class F420-dependent oxidoreductase [Actinomycetota bacterium]
MGELQPEIRVLLEGRNFAHLASLLPNGSPHSVPIWIGVEGDRIVFFTQPQSRKAQNLERDGRVAISVTDQDNPYRSAWIRGRVAGTRVGDEGLEIIDRISNVYTGQPFPMRSGVVYEIEPERSGFVELPFRHEPA